MAKKFLSAGPRVFGERHVPAPTFGRLLVQPNRLHDQVLHESKNDTANNVEHVMSAEKNPGNGDSGAPSENGQTEEDMERVEPEKEEGHGQSARSVAGRKGEFINTVSHQHVTLIDQRSSSPGESLDDGDEYDVDDEKKEHVNPQVLAETEVQHGHAAGQPKNTVKRQLHSFHVTLVGVVSVTLVESIENMLRQNLVLFQNLLELLERQKYRMTERRKDGKTERRKDRETERQKDKAALQKGEAEKQKD